MEPKSGAGGLTRWLRWPQDMLGRRRQRLVLHGFGLDDLAQHELQAMVPRLSRDLKLDLALSGRQGDVVLVESALRQTVSSHMLAAFAEGRPLLVVAREPAPQGQARGPVDYEALREQVWALAQRFAADTTAPAPLDSLLQTDFDGRSVQGEDSGFDSRHPGAVSPDEPLDEANAQFLRYLHAGKADPERPPLVAGYGPGAMLMLDFAGGQALMQPAAANELRVGSRLPRMAIDWAPGRDVTARELDRVIWDLGWAAGSHALLGAPEDWWYTPLQPLRLDTMPRYSAAPLHRDMARVLARGGVTPSQLRRECHASVGELRRFLQAGLFLALLHWPGPDGALA